MIRTEHKISTSKANDESPQICGELWALAGSTNRHKKCRYQTDHSEKQQVSKFHNSSFVPNIISVPWSGAFDGRRLPPRRTELPLIASSCRLDRAPPF